MKIIASVVQVVAGLLVAVGAGLLVAAGASTLAGVGAGVTVAGVLGLVFGVALEMGRT